MKENHSMRWLVLGIFALLAIGVVATRATLTIAPATSLTLNENIDMHDYGPAPALTNTIWLNTDTPLRLADLRGRVVALDMWTFG